MICLCLSGNSLASWSAQLEQNREWISLVELRIDLLRPAERSPTAIGRWWTDQRRDLPAILTIRRPRDLGRWEGDEAQRAYLFEELLDTVRPDYVDLELDRRGEPSWDRIALRVRGNGGAVIRSHHETRETPRELSQLMARLCGEPREIPMLAVHLHSTDDLCSFVKAADEFRARMPGRRAIWVGSGDHGTITRVFPARFNSAWTYVVGEGEAPVTPGQIDARTAKELYRVGEARAEWPLFAVVGSPVGHSRSPEYHNGRFIADGRRAVYVPLLVDRFERFPDLAALLRLRGVSVTVPHKEAALKTASVFADGEGAETLKRIGAANTLVRIGAESSYAGGWCAANTDLEGFLAPLHDLYRELDRLRVAVIGAGGAARAVVAGLVAHSADVHIFNRTQARALDLARDMGLTSERARSLDDLVGWEHEPFDLIVQTTNVGMSAPADEGQDPVPEYRFRGTETVYDIIYTPPETALLARARAAGCRTINGKTMFDRQADLQYRLFTAAIDGA